MKSYAAECLGTFVLVFGGCGSAVLAADHIGYAGVAAGFGLSLLAMIYTIGPISGCHLNPAVPLGLVMSGKFDSRRAPGYMIHLVSIPVTNTSVNPARSIGPALFAGAGAFEQLWLFILAPLIGGALASFLYTAIRPVDPDAQITMRAATQALPAEQAQRLDVAVGTPPISPTP